MKNRSLAAVLAMAMVLTLLPVTALAAEEPARLPDEPAAVEVPEVPPAEDIPEPETVTLDPEEAGPAQPAPAALAVTAGDALPAGDVPVLLAAAEDGEGGAEGGSGIPAIKLDLTLEDQPVGSLYFTTSGTEAVLADAEDLTGAIKVPERFEHNGVTYRVTEVGPSALANQTGMTQIWLPNNLSEIGPMAFAGCDHLKAVGSYTEGGEADPYALPDALLEIHQETFYGCTRLSSVKIGPNVTDIWHWAFAYCYSLGQNYTDANGVTYGVYFDLGSRLRYIHQGAFQKCIVLENITLPNTLESIGPNAFQECTAIMERNGKEEYVGLKNLVLPDSVKTIGEKAFMYCFTLDTLSIPATVETIEDKAFYSCSHLKNLEFRGEGSKDIAMGTMVFYWCRSLENIQLPGNLRVLPAWTFAYAAVEHPNVAVTLPQGMERVGQYAFNESGISSITFSDTVSSVGILAFGDCHNLREIHWPNRPDDAPLSLGMMAFTDCENLTEVTLPRLLYLPITEQDFGGDNVFYDCDNLRKVTVEEGASFIPERCFRDCDALQTVTLPASLETIHEQAFYSCPSLTDIDLSTATGLKTIGELAFCRAAMSSVSLPASVESIGREAFSINQNLTGFTVAANSAGGYYAADGVLYQTAGNETHLVCYPAGHAGADFAVPGGVTHIDRGACSFAEALVTVTFPDTLKAIDHYAFSHCVNLKTAQIGAGVTQGSGIFDGCYHLDAITIPQGTTVLGGGGFGEKNEFPALSKVTSLTIPASVTDIRSSSVKHEGEYVVGSPFQDLTQLADIQIEAGNTHFVVQNGVLFTADRTTLLSYPPARAGERYTVPDGVTTIALYAFMNASHLKEVTIPASVENIGMSAFYNVPNLERVNIYRSFDAITTGIYDGYAKFLGSNSEAIQVYVQGDPNDPAAAEFTKAFDDKCADSDIFFQPSRVHVDLIAPAEKAGDRFLEGGVIYTLTDATHVKVGANPNYQGSQVTVPATVTHGGVTYTVTGVEAGAFAAAANLTKASVLLSANEIGANAFDGKVAVTTRDTMADFTLNTRYLAYGDTLVVSAPAAVAEGAAVTLTGAQGSVTASVKGGTAAFPVDKDFYHAVDSKGVGVSVTLTGGGVTTGTQLIVSPKTYTSDDVPWYNPSVHSYHISKPYDGTTAIDVVTAEPLAGFTEKGDDLAIRFYNGNTRYAEAAPLINESFYGELELVGADKDYYAIDPTLAREAATYFKVHVSYGQLYIKEVDGVLQKPVFRRVWNVNDGLRVRDCGPGGGQFVAYFPTVDDAGKITGYDTVDVGGYFRYTDDNPYPAFQDAGDFPVQMEGVYHWEFVPTGNGEWQSKLDNFRFSGAFKPWDTSLVPSETGDTGETGENPPLPGYVTDSQPDQPALPSGGDTAVQPTPPTDDKQPDEKPDDKPTTGGGSTGGSSTGGGSTGGATTGGGTVTSPGAATVTASAVSQAVKAAGEDAPVVLKADKDTVKLTAQNLKTIAGHGAGVTVETPAGALTLDGKALAQVQGTGKADATLSLEKVAAADLTKAQTDALKGAPVYDLAVTAGGKTVTGFDDGGVQVSIPWDAAAGDLIACQVAEDGALTPVPTSALVDGKMVFQTDRLCQYALVENTAQFRDAQAHWARSDVSFTAGRGIVVGVGGGDFHPDSPATVEAVVTVLGRLAGVADTDDAAHWSQPHMAWAEDAGILPDGLNATAPITREQLAYLLARYMDQTGDGEAAAYADLDQIDAQYLASVRQVRQLGLMQGRQDNTFDPQGSLTRGELAAVLHRLILVRLQQDG